MTQFQVECIESDTGEDQSLYGKFVMEPLERGQGITVGNALRRVLLSNLPGTSVTSVRIAGVTHEFATIPGVREDVLDILLNMKDVALRSYSPQPQIGRLLVQGPTSVTAGHLDLSADVEVVNPSHYIATVSAGATLEMEFRIETGTGYRAVERGRDEAAALDFLQIDAVFMPVLKVHYSVESTRIGGSTEQDRLIMECGQTAVFLHKTPLVKPLVSLSIYLIPSKMSRLFQLKMERFQRRILKAKFRLKNYSFR